MAQADLTELLSVREALALVRSGPAEEQGEPIRVGVACSFTPLHLATLLRGYLQRRFPERSVELREPTYGDLVTALQQQLDQPADGVVVVVEWPDLDPRLGRRESVSAPLVDVDEIVATARLRLDLVRVALEKLAARRRTVVALPSLTLPPSYAAPGGRVGVLEARLDVALAEFVAAVTAVPEAVVVRQPADDGDLRTTIQAGFPYTRAHASRLARDCSDLLYPAPAKKGIITDLDDTLWLGLVGEVGPDNVHWDLDAGGHPHALYQQLLASLARRGVLVGIASKNDPAVAEQGLARPDILLRAEHYFPVVASWAPKSEAVTTILETWNIGAQDVVFVDDNPAELDEVGRRHPGMTLRRFPVGDAAACGELLREINELFWHERTTDEDVLRLASIRAGAEADVARSTAATPVDFIHTLNGRLTLDREDGWARPRARELVNKTNQFNLNGRRFSAAEWTAHCVRPDAVNVVVEYADRFGALGTISVLTGRHEGDRLTVDCWVMSCRAFARAIEHHLLAWLFDDLQLDDVAFEVEETDRNQPLRDFLTSIGATTGPGGPRIRRESLTGSGLLGSHTVETTGQGGGAR